MTDEQIAEAMRLADEIRHTVHNLAVVNFSRWATAPQLNDAMRQRDQAFEALESYLRSLPKA